MQAQDYASRPQFSQTLPTPGRGGSGMYGAPPPQQYYGSMPTQMMQDQQYYAPRSTSAYRQRRPKTWEKPTLSYTCSLGMMPDSLQPNLGRGYGRRGLGRPRSHKSEPRYKWGTTRDINSMVSQEYQIPKVGRLNPMIQSPIICCHTVNLAERNKTGVPVADKKPSGISRNAIGGHYTS